jgi:hypothetical protein
MEIMRLKFWLLNVAYIIKSVQVFSSRIRQLLREILSVCSATFTVINSASLISPTQGNGLTGYQLKIGTTTLNDACRNSLLPLLKENEVELEEAKDSIVFYKRYL